MLNLGIGQGEFLVTRLNWRSSSPALSITVVVMKTTRDALPSHPKGETNYYHGEIARGLPFSEETLEIPRKVFIGCPEAALRRVRAFTK